MAFNNSEAARQKRVIRDLQLKISLENALTGKLRGFFRRLTSDFRAIYTSTGQILNVSNYEDELIDILRPHYRSVAKKFSRNVRKEIKSIFLLNMEYKQEDPEIDGEIRAFVNVTPVIQAGYIIDTTQNVINQVVQSIIAQQIVTGQVLSNAEIASKSAIEINKKNIARASMIAQTETQKAAEGVKFIEANTLISTGSEVNGQQVSDMTQKEWNAVLDTNVRSFHADADGQRRPVDQPYLVNDELLNYPGDTSLGASLNNVINCRCGSQYVIDAQTITAEQVDLRPRDFSQAGSPLITRFLKLNNIQACPFHNHSSY